MSTQSDNKTRLSEKERDLLTRTFKDLSNEDETDYIYNVKSVLESQQFIDELSTIQEDTTAEEKLMETKEKLSEAILVASGTRKIIEQLYSENASVSLGKNEANVKRALRRTLKVNSNEITFDMYKQAIERMREYSQTIKEAAINEQLI